MQASFKFALTLLLLYSIFALAFYKEHFAKRKYYITRIDGTNNTLIITNRFTGVIFDHHKVAVYEESTSNLFTPTPEEVLVAEATLERCYSPSNPALIGPRTTTTALYPLEQYYRQYFGAVWKDGRRIIWINSFRSFSQDKEWHRKKISIVDGGINYFNICVDLSTQTCSYFFINSEGG